MGNARLQVIADFANGEIKQATMLFDTSLTFDEYMEKSFFKTASLIAASAKSAAIFSGVDETAKNAMYDYGKHLGLAFQVSHSSQKLNHFVCLDAQGTGRKTLQAYGDSQRLGTQLMEWTPGPCP